MLLILIDIKSNKFVQLNGIITIKKIRDMDNNPDHKFLEDLEDDEDVQNVFTNFNFGNI